MTILDNLDEVGLGLALKREFVLLHRAQPDADPGQYAAVAVRALQSLAARQPCPKGCIVEDDSPGDRQPMVPHTCEACGRMWVWDPQAFRWIRCFPQ